MNGGDDIRSLDSTMSTSIGRPFSADTSAKNAPPKGGQAFQNFTDWFNNDRTYIISLACIGVLGLALMIGGAIDVSNTSDEFTKKVETPCRIVNAEINKETNCGALVVQYKVDGNTFRIYDDVTEPMLCADREDWLLEMRKRYMGTDPPPWPLVRYNPTYFQDATLVEKKYDAMGVGFLVTGIILLLLVIILVVMLLGWKLSPAQILQDWFQKRKATKNANISQLRGR
jgi:hypothetical protein